MCLAFRCLAQWTRALCPRPLAFSQRLCRTGLPHVSVSRISCNRNRVAPAGRRCFATSPSLVSDDSRAIEWEYLLEDALLYGIWNKDQLLFEADVGHSQDLGSRLADAAPARQNIDLWLVLLRGQALRNGHDGIKAIWRGLRYRGQAVRLDDKDERINSLWSVFLTAGATDNAFLWEICRETIRSDFQRPAILAEIVGAALEGDAPLNAVRFAAVLKEYYRGQLDLQQMVPAVLDSKHPDALKAFCKVYDKLPPTPIYSDIIPQLWQRNRADDAFFMHSFLTSRNDLPPNFEILEPFIQHLVVHHGNLKSFLKPMTDAGASFDAQARRLWSREWSRIVGMSSESLNVVASTKSGVKSHKLSERFAARAFATRSMSFDFAVNSMRMMGLIEVGPLSIREMSLSAPDLETLQYRFKKLEELEIDTGSSTFARTITNACRAGRWNVLQLLINNDLHHDTFADRELQMNLLPQYYENRDWPQVNRTLAILNEGRFDAKAQEKAANLLLLSMLKVGDYKHALDMMSDMRHRGQDLMAKQIASHVLYAMDKEYKMGFKRRRKASTDNIGLFIGLLQHVVGSGMFLDLRTWRKPLLALGQFGRFNELESLAMWICEWYHPDGLHRHVIKRPIPDDKTYFDRLFDGRFQRMLVAWCFRPVKRKSVVAEHCLRWTRILKRLRDEHGVTIKDSLVTQIYIKRLRILFTKSPLPVHRAHNRIMRARNSRPLSHYWALFNLMWGEPPQGRNFDEMDVAMRDMQRLERVQDKVRRRRRAIGFRYSMGAAEVRQALLERKKRSEQEATSRQGIRQQTT